MAVGFSTDVIFGVKPDDSARLPFPVPAADSTAELYAATIILASYAQFLLLKSYLSGYNLLPAMGGGGLVQVTRGRGTRTLTVPVGAGVEETYRGLLTALSPRPYMIADSHLEADVEFLILGPDS